MWQQSERRELADRRLAMSLATHEVPAAISCSSFRCLHLAGHANRSRVVPHFHALKDLWRSLPITIGETIDTPARVLRANIVDFVSVQKDGTVLPDFSRMTRAQAEALAEITMEVMSRSDEEVVRKVRIKLHDKLAAADKLLRHLGGYRSPRGQPPRRVRLAHR